MSQKAKEDFIRRNKHLSLDELSAKTGMRKRHVKRILEALKSEDRPAAPVKYKTEINRRLLWLSAFLVASVTFLSYLPVLSNGFVNWDDPPTITDNPHIRLINLQSIRWMFTAFHAGVWMPLTWLSLAFDYSLGRLDARIYHLGNLFLHGLNTALVFFLGLKILSLAGRNRAQGEMAPRTALAMPAALLAASLFGLHPIHVESVAWATERKDVLCGLFFLSSLLVYLDYASSHDRKPRKLVACLGLFILALLAKPMAITLPFALLLLDGWPLQRFRSGLARVLREKIPFFAAALLSGLATIRAAQATGESLATQEGLSPAFRILNAFHSLIFYIWKMMVPVDLVPFYPISHQREDVFSPAYLIAVPLVILISLTCLLYRQKRPYLLVGWLYYVITLAPVLGILQVGGQAAADRFTYLPSLSLFLLFSTLVTAVFLNRRMLLTVACAALTAGLGYGTVRQLAVWKDSQTLWEAVVRVYPDSRVPHANLANAYKAIGRLDDALVEYDRALAIPPPHAFIHDGKGTALFDKGRVDESILEFQAAIALDPKYASPHRNLWFVYQRKGMHDRALAEIQEAIRLDPEFAEAYNNLAISYGTKGQFEKSEAASKTGLSLDPYNAKYLVNLATTYQRAGRLEEAISLYKRGLELNPNEAIYFLNLGNTYLLKGMLSEAVEMLQRAADLQPGNAGIYEKLAAAYEKTGQKELASQNYAKAIALKSGDRP